MFSDITGNTNQNEPPETAEIEIAVNDPGEMAGAIESILFVSGEPVPLSQLAMAVGTDTSTALSVVEGLKDRYAAEKRGISIIPLGDGYQMCSNPDYFKYIQRLYANVKKKALTQPLLETLAIIAYKQPVAKAQIEDIRGVNADHAVNRLMEYGLVEEKGRLETPGKPIIFGTSDEFLRFFGFSSLKELPPLAEKTGAILEEAKADAEALISEPMPDIRQLSLNDDLTP